MSLISAKLNTNDQGKITDEKSPWMPTPHERDRYSLMRESFVVGNMNMNTPRREFNDLSLLERMSVDRMSWNTYQPNDGSGYMGDPMNSWKSNAIKPVVRNKCISMTVHATEQLIFPKVFAQNDNSDEDKAAAEVMRDLIEFTAHQSKYAQTFVYTTINAIVDPIAIVYTEYCEVYRTVRKMDSKGHVSDMDVLDERYSGFQDVLVSPNELYIENVYEHDIQKQGFVLWRKVISYQTAKAKYEKEYDNFKYVKPGMQTVYSDANNAFYYVYDANLTGDLVEEIIYWNPNLDLKLTFVNGILLSDADTPNPRLDKKLPFATTGYEPIDGGRFFYYKSLVFKMGPDARIVNELYPMIVDATYLSIFPPMMSKGGEEIASDVIVPGAVTNLSSPDGDLKAINTANNLAAGMNTLQDVLGSIDQSNIGAQGPKGVRTAYQAALAQKEIGTDLSLFLKMVGWLVEDFGNLRVSDIIQHMTIAEVAKIAGKDVLKYKTFLLPQTGGTNGRRKSKKIMFSNDLPSEPVTESQILLESIKIMEMEGGPNAKKEINMVNPELFAQLKYQLVVAPDAMSPLSDEIQHAFRLEAYDRMIASPLENFDKEQATKDTLLAAYDFSRDDPDRYFKQANPMPSSQAPGGNVQSAQGGYAAGQVGPAPSAADIMNKVGASGKSGGPVPTRANQLQ